MPINANATFIFALNDEWDSAYRVTDTGIEMNFLCPAPGPGQNSYYTIMLTDAELASVTNQAQLRTLVTTKLNRKIRATNIASKLDQFVGQSITI